MSKQPRDVWGNLAGPPARWSPAVRPGGKNRRSYDGLIKLRLAHSEGRSYFIPDVLIAVGGSRFFLPSYFSPPVLSFNIEPGRHIAEFSIDVGNPRAIRLERFLVRIESENLVSSYADGAQLYKCTFEASRGIVDFAKGACRRDESGDFLLRVYHHTTSGSAVKIRQGGELWSSPWNLAGTRQLANVSYGYFTTLPSVKSEEDLRLIAMASDERIRLQTTSNRLREEVLELKVYRGSTLDRTAALEFHVPAALIAPSHLYLYPSVGTEPAYFEVVSPEIVRVGVVPSAILRFSPRSEVSVDDVHLKRFDYIIIGDTGMVEGLAAPFNEEETKQIAHLERLDGKPDLFDFWLEHANTDQVSGRVIEPRKLSPL